jgi:hypothetical protein
MTNPQFLRQARLALAAQWALYATAAWAFGVMSIGAMFQRPLADPLSMGLLGLLLGLGQIVILARYITLPRGLWVLLTGAGAALGQALSQSGVILLGDRLLVLISRPGGAIVLGLMLGALFGLCIGGLTWLLLRRQQPAAHAWILVNILGWALGMGLSAALVINLLLSSVLATLVSSLVSGAWVSQLLRE